MAGDPSRLQLDRPTHLLLTTCHEWNQFLLSPPSLSTFKSWGHSDRGGDGGALLPLFPPQADHRSIEEGQLDVLQRPDTPRSVLFSSCCVRSSTSATKYYSTRLTRSLYYGGWRRQRGHPIRHFVFFDFCARSLVASPVIKLPPRRTSSMQPPGGQATRRCRGAALALARG